MPKRHLDLTTANLNGAIAVALDLDDQPGLDWERAGAAWELLWAFPESSAKDMARYLSAHYDVVGSVRHERSARTGGQAGTVLCVVAERCRCSTWPEGRLMADGHRPDCEAR